MRVFGVQAIERLMFGVMLVSMHLSFDSFFVEWNCESHWSLNQFMCNLFLESMEALMRTHRTPIHKDICMHIHMHVSQTGTAIDLSRVGETIFTSN